MTAVPIWTMNSYVLAHAEPELVERFARSRRTDRWLEWEVRGHRRSIESRWPDDLSVISASPAEASRSLG